MTIANFDVWVSDMQELIDVPRRTKLRLTENGLTLVPVSNAHARTQGEIEKQIDERLPGWEATKEFGVNPAREGYRPEPDVAAIRIEDVDATDAYVYEDKLPFVIEIVSKESRTRDYETKPSHYALRGIPAYLVVDVHQATWTLYQEPEEAKYQRVTEGEFGEEVVIPVDGELMLRLDSSKFRRFA
jgi:Uma2 family endonuclease